MSIISSIGRGEARADRASSHAPCRYLTDGTGLYRRAAELDDLPGYVLLEDCRTLRLFFIAAEEADRLDDVNPAQTGTSVADPRAG